MSSTAESTTSPFHWSELLPLGLGLIVLAILHFSSLLGWLLHQPATEVLIGLTVLSGIVLWIAKGITEQAEDLAVVLGEPYGTLVLTGSVITIEVALLANTMLTGEANPTLARDSMFAVLMISLTGVKGISLLVASNQQERGLTSPVQVEDLASRNMTGSLTYINLITTMSVLALIVPNFSRSTQSANFSTPLNIVLCIVATGVYSIFLAYQVGSYRQLFMEAPSQSMRLAAALQGKTAESGSERPLWQISTLLVSGLLILVFISESVGKLIERGISELGLPSSIAGVLVAMLILAPEALNAIQAAGKGELQRTLNTIYGAALSTISLTVPAVLIIGELTHTNVILGLEPFEMVMLALTLLLVRPLHSRVNGLDGVMLLVVFLFWIALQIA
ncbi:MAG: calcium:proton antiporter [Prochlorococcus sp.]